MINLYFLAKLFCTSSAHVIGITFLWFIMLLMSFIFAWRRSWIIMNNIVNDTVNDKKGHNSVNESFAHKPHDLLVLDGTNGMKYELSRLALKRIYNSDTTLSTGIPIGLHWRGGIHVALQLSVAWFQWQNRSRILLVDDICGIRNVNWHDLHRGGARRGRNLIRVSHCEPETLLKRKFTKVYSHVTSVTHVWAFLWSLRDVLENWNIKCEHHLLLP